MSEVSTETPPRFFKGIAIFAVIWNAIGVATYLMQVTMSDEALAALPSDQQALYANIPAWATSAYAIAVFAGLAASIGLLMKKKWAVPLFLLSLIGIVVQMFQAIFLSDMLSVMGPGSAVMPILVTVIALWLYWYARGIAGRGWLA
jgi:hypothetical protein